VANSNDIDAIMKTLSSMFKKEHVHFTQNATTSIWALIKALGIVNKKIVVPANVCFVVPCAIILSGNKPFFVDIDKSYSASLEDLQNINEPDVEALIYPYNYGNVGNIDKIVEVAKDKGWKLIEDVAQALGAKFNGNYVGSFSDYSIVSFGEGKIIDAGHGGAVNVNDKTLYQEIVSITEKLQAYSELSQNLYTSYNRFYNNMVQSIENGEDISLFGKPLSYCYKDALLMGLNIHPLTVKYIARELNELNELEKHVEVRNQNASYYRELIEIEEVQVIKHTPGSVYWRQNIRVPSSERGRLLQFLRNNGIKASKYFPSIDQMFFKRSKNSMFRESDQMYSELINLWSGHHTTYKDVLNVSFLLTSYFKKNSNIE